ncbi:MULTISPECIES: DOMON-like domain-containing protein [Novosphingobium]|uniref:DOMON-like domain-containing protein n=1 Tax=Novosphingobium TaxID=165696 RepID=UPI001CD71AA4|nr:DOMON-like domain-containing protein [Novosphingobium percolationis]MCH7627569.1 DOMON-like domain-containing protein [Pseudomonadota bacterium]
METFELVPHPAHPPLHVTAVAARIIGKDAHWLTVRWRVEGTQALVLPPFAGRVRTDSLWQTTCFELFVKPDGGEAYAEFNFSPSERWAAYDFYGYREGMAERAMPRQPICTPRRGQAVLIFDAVLPVAALPALPASYALTAVIEEDGAGKSYWAMAHGREVPDFHHASCFAARLAAPQAA